MRERINWFADLFREMAEWRDTAVHRIQPLVVVHSKGLPELAPPEEVSIQPLDKREMERPEREMCECQLRLNES
jgi:hypothetical protein